MRVPVARPAAAGHDFGFQLRTTAIGIVPSAGRAMVTGNLMPSTGRRMVSRTRDELVVR
jgi:hypothetical protein